MKKTDDKLFLKKRAEVAANARWMNHTKELWTSVRITRSVKNRLTSLEMSTPCKAIEALVTLYWSLYVLNQNGKLNKSVKVVFEDVKNSF